MSEVDSLSESSKAQFRALNDGGRSSSLNTILQETCKNRGGSAPSGSEDESTTPLVVHPEVPYIAGEEEAITKDNHISESANDASLKLLQVIFREFFGITPKPSSDYTEEIQAFRKRFFGLAKGSSSEGSSNNRYDYEQKYPRDPPGKEAAGDARVWLTYLDEAEIFDREKVDGWKETADVLLVFAGLFSGVITTFVSQASQSLQKDNTQVSASLLFEIAQILRAQSDGTPINSIPRSTLTPVSPFSPSTNAFLVNGLWFTSLAITLSTALFAVLSKQWLYYYLSSITGTAHEKARARQLRFNGFELWKVGAIVDLLPILLHLAVGFFLTGIIILLFPLDGHVAWIIFMITGITYLLYFVSVILPIRYPECPYTTSLTIYVANQTAFVGFLFWTKLLGLSLCDRQSSSSTYTGSLTPHMALRNVTWVVGRPRALHHIHRLLRHISNAVRHAFSSISELAGVACRGLQKLRDTIFAQELPKSTNWREESIKRATENMALLDFEALDRLYTISPNRSVHRIIARCIAVHPSIGQEFGFHFCEDILRTLDVSETNMSDLRYGLCLDIQTIGDKHWRLFRSITNVDESQLEDTEYQSYSRIANNVLGGNYRQIMTDVLNHDLKLPLVMWRHFLKKVPRNATVAAHILIHGQNGLFDWKSACTTRVISFHNTELGWWKFDYLFRYFFDDTETDYSPEKAFETRYLLLIAIYHNLTSDQPLVLDKARRGDALLRVFRNFRIRTNSPNRIVFPENYFTFFRDVFCVDAFWSESMTHGVRTMAALRLDNIWDYVGADMVNCFRFAESHDLASVYGWCSRDLDIGLLLYTTPIFTLLFMPQNRDSLCTTLLNDPNAVHNLSNCFRNLGNCYNSLGARTHMLYPNLMGLFKYVKPEAPLFNILYSSSVLVQVWRLLVFREMDVKKFLLAIKSKVDQERLMDLHAAMTDQVRSSEDSHMRLALEKSAREFERIMNMSHLQAESFTANSMPEHATDKNLDIEERAIANECENSHKSIIQRIKKSFGQRRPS